MKFGVRLKLKLATTIESQETGCILYPSNFYAMIKLSHMADDRYNPNCQVGASVI